MNLIGSTFFLFVQNTIHDFCNTVIIELIVALTSINATKPPFFNESRFTSN